MAELFQREQSVVARHADPHLVKGCTANTHRLKECRRSLRLVENVIRHDEASSEEARGLLSEATDYTCALDLLENFSRLRKKFGGPEFFGIERDDNLHGSCAAVMQSFDGRDPYPSLEAKAARLLCFLVKNHSFGNGNTRIPAAQLLWFLERNGTLYRLLEW